MNATEEEAKRRKAAVDLAKELRDRVDRDLKTLAGIAHDRLDGEHTLWGMVDATRVELRLRSELLVDLLEVLVEKVSTQKQVPIGRVKTVYESSWEKGSHDPSRSEAK